MNIMGIVSIAVGALLLIGFLIGFLRSWRRSTLRLGFLIACFVGAIFLTSTVSKILMDNFVHGLVISAFGFTVDINEMAGDIAGDLLTDGSAITNFATALLNIIINIVGFLLVFIALCLVSFIIYLIVAAIISSKVRKKAVGKVKTKGWERLIGGVVGAVGALVVCLAILTPVFGVMSVCDKFLEDTDSKSASAYSQTVVCGKFYTEDSNIGTVETYLKKYDDLRKEYNNSFAGILFKYTGADAIGKATFKKLSTVKQNNLNVDLTSECVNIVNCYNLYKTNFIEKTFDITNNDSVAALEKIYGVAKKSEVLKGVVLDVIPKMASKWTNGEQFLGMDCPLDGDTGELVLILLDAFNTDDFDVFDKNIEVTFKAIKTANNHNIIKSVKDGSEMLDVIGEEDEFIYDEIKVLSESNQVKKALPKLMNRIIKIAYKSAVCDPEAEGYTGEVGDENYEAKSARKTSFTNVFGKEFTQAEIAAIDWDNEANQMQTIVSEMVGFFGNTDTKDNLLDNLSGFGKVIDAARESGVLSEPLQLLMHDYIEDNVAAETLGAGAKTTVLNTITQKWSLTENYSFASLFDTIQSTANAAKNIATADFSDIGNVVKDLLKEENIGAKETILSLVGDDEHTGVLENFLGENETTTVFKELLTDVINHTTLDEKDEEGNIVTVGSIEKDIAAGQVIVDIISNSGNNTESILSDYTGENDTEKATALLNTVGSSTVILQAATSEAAEDAVDSFINTMNSEDLGTIKGVIVETKTLANRALLAKLFNVNLED